MKSSLKISFRNSSFQRQSHLLCVCSEAFQIRYLLLIFGIKFCWRVSQSVTHKHELWIRFTLSYAMMKALHLTWHSATHKRERRIWFPLIYRHLMKALLRLAAVRDTKQAGELRGDTTIYCFEFCAGFNDAKRQHLSTINTNSDLSFTTIQQQTYRRNTSIKQDWELVFIKLHFCIDPMTILLSFQAVPPHFTTKLRPWFWVYRHNCRHAADQRSDWDSWKLVGRPWRYQHGIWSGE